MSSFVSFNGKIIPEEDVIISPNNTSFKFGDGCFETIKVINGKVILSDLHFKRFFTSLEQLQFEIPLAFSPDYFINQILDLCSRNNLSTLARIRLTAFRGDGSLYSNDDSARYIIQTSQLNEEVNDLNKDGLQLDFFYDAKKVCDRYSSIKSNNFLPYVMAAKWVVKMELDDCILFNAYDKVADSTIANIFIISNGIISTPPLTDGAIGGVMRNYLLKELKRSSYPVTEKSLDKQDLLQANEIFLTNAIRGIRWVKQLGNTNYNNNISSLIHQKFIAPLYL